MKKIFLSFLVILLTGFIACSNDSGKDSDNSTSTKRTIKGIAAIGAVIEEGAKVEVRPASVDGTPADVIEGTVGANGEYIVTIPEEIPVESDPIIDETTVKSISKSSLSTEMEQGTGFIVRVWSEAAHSWVYSYSENDGAETIANVNPYTDMMIRVFYRTANNTALSTNGFPFIYGDILNGYDNTNIDHIFNEGVFKKLDTDGVAEIAMPINVPLSTSIDTAMTVMSKMLYRLYNLSDIQNALDSSWTIDTGLDALLTAGGRNRMNEYLQYEFENLFFRPDALLDACAIQEEVGRDVTIDIWTKYGGTGITYLYYNSITYGINVTTSMLEQADSVEGNRHFKASVFLGTQLEDNRLFIYIGGYPEESTCLMIKRQ